MNLNKSKGHMFANVDFTGTYYQGCDHGCKICWSQFLPWGTISHEPRLVQTDEHELLKVRDATIFLNSAHDSFAACNPRRWILAMLRWIRRQDKSLVFYLQSQNLARAASKFLGELDLVRDQVIIGTTIQTDNEEIINMISKNAPSIRSRYYAMLRFGVRGFKLRLSLEPLYRFHLLTLSRMVQDIAPDQIMVGLDNYVHKHKLEIPQPIFSGYLRLYKDLTDAEIEVIEKPSVTKWREKNNRPA